MRTSGELTFILLLFLTTVEAEIELTACLGNSVCGFLQANSKGVSKVPYCNCSHADCPMNWDPYDGKSLTQSTSDQYKFCEFAPTNLQICNVEDPSNPSYTSFQYYDRSTRYKEMLKDEIFCLCPEGYNYLDTRYVFYQWGSYDVVQINSYCLPLPQCMEEQICKEITDMPGEFLVNPICQCPEEMSCPSVGPKNVDVMVTDKKVTVFNVKCQNSESREHRYSKMMTYGQMLMIPPRQRFNF